MASKTRVWKVIFGALAFATAMGVMGYFFLPPANRATFAVPGTDIEIAVELTPTSHWYFPLAEYNRVLVLKSKGGSRIEREMDSDSGGYARGNLYRRPSGDYLIEGYFDLWQVTLRGPLP